MIIDGVNFNESVCRSMTKAKFISAHAPYIFLNLDPEERKKKLECVYKIIKPTKSVAE